MAGLSEQIVAAITTALTGAIPAVGSRVYRARQDAVTREECPAITIDLQADSEEVASLDGAIVRVEAQISVSVHVQAGGVWETAADAVMVPAHALVRGATLPGGATIDSAFDEPAAVSGDQAPGYKTKTYTISYYRQAAALDAVPA